MQRLYKLHKFYDPCVYTGQSDININSEFSKFFKGNVFYKDNINDDRNRLFKRMKELADERIETQLKRKFYRVYEVFDNHYIDASGWRELFPVLKMYTNDSRNKGLNGYFTVLRKVIELLIKATHKHGFLPEEFVYDSKNKRPHLKINPSIYFHTKPNYSLGLNTYKNKQPISEIAISQSLNYITKITQTNSHYNDHLEKVNTTNIFISCLLQLFDVLIWFKIYIDSDPPKGNWTIEKNNVTNKKKNNRKTFSNKAAKNKIKSNDNFGNHPEFDKLKNLK